MVYIERIVTISVRTRFIAFHEPQQPSQALESTDANNKSVLVQYQRDRKGRKVGMVVAFKNGNMSMIGYSKCKIKEDRFDREVGMSLAMQRAVPVRCLDLDKVPYSTRNTMAAVADRAERVFNNQGGQADGRSYRDYSVHSRLCRRSQSSASCSED